eukprot:3050860-Prymnesium_polylepis.4
MRLPTLAAAESLPKTSTRAICLPGCARIARPSICSTEAASSGGWSRTTASSEGILNPSRNWPTETTILCATPSVEKESHLNRPHSSTTQLADVLLHRGRHVVGFATPAGIDGRRANVVCHHPCGDCFGFLVQRRVRAVGNLGCITVNGDNNLNVCWNESSEVDAMREAEACGVGGVCENARAALTKLLCTPFERWRRGEKHRVDAFAVLWCQEDVEDSSAVLKLVRLVDCQNHPAVVDPVQESALADCPQQGMCHDHKSRIAGAREAVGDGDELGNYARALCVGDALLVALLVAVVVVALLLVAGALPASYALDHVVGGEMR